MEAEFAVVVCADDPKLLDKLDEAAKKGEIENVAQMRNVTVVGFT